MKKINLLTAGLLFAGTGLFAAGGDNLALQKEIMAQQAKVINNPALIGSANIKKGVFNPAINRQGSKDTVIVGMDNPPKGEFLPMYATTSYDFPVKYLVFSRLLKTNELGELVPEICEEYPAISADNKTFTFKLRKDVCFSDGVVLTAKDIRFTFEIISDPVYDGSSSYLAENITGYKEYNNGNAEHLAGIKIIDDYEIQFTFNEAKVNNIESFNLGIVPEHYFAHKKGDLKPVLQKMRKPIGSGPYTLKNFEPRQYVELTKNEKYWDKKPQIKNIIIRYVNQNVSAQALIKGEIDMWPGEITPEKIEMADRSGFINRNQYLRHGYGYLNINCADPVMKDKNVRIALLLGLDREAFLHLYFKGLAIPLDTVCSLTWWMYDKDFHGKIQHYPYDPEKAKKMLDEAGWKIGSDGYRYKAGKKMTIIWAATKDLDLVDILMPILLQNWKELGVDVKIKRLDFNSLMDLLYKEKKGFSIANLALGEGVYPNPRESWHSSQDKIGGKNPHFVSKECDEMIDKMEGSLDKKDYKKEWQKWILFMNKEVPRYILYSNVYTDLYNNRIKNLETSPLYRWYDYGLQNAYIDNGK